MIRYLAAVVSIVLAGAAFGAPAKVNVDTKTRAVTVDDGINTLDYKGCTLTLGNVTISDSSGIRTFDFGSTNGTKLGSTGNKIGFLGATPIVRPSSTTDLRQALINLGLYTTGGATPLNLNGGAFTAAVITGTNGVFSGTMAVTGNATIGGTLGVTGAFTGTSMTLSGNETVNGNQTVAGSSTLHGITGTTLALSSTLNVSGLTTLAGVNATNGAFSGTLGVTGTSTLGVLNATNSAFSGTLGVTGVTTLTTVNATTGTFSGDLNVGGDSDFTGDAAFGEDITVDGTATVAGAFAADSGNFANGLTVIGPSGLRNTTVTGTLGITGLLSGTSFSFSSNGTVTGTLGVTGALSGTSAAFYGNETVGGTLVVTGATTGSTASYSSTVRGAIQDKGGRVFHALAYGIVGDGTTDNTAAIATMFAAGASASNPVFVFPGGTYLTDPATVPDGSVVEGAGMTITTIKARNGAAFSIVLTFTADNVTIRDLTVDGNRGNVTQTGLNGADACINVGGSHALIERVEVTHSEFSGIFIGGASASPAGVTVSHCWIHHNGGTVSTGNGTGIFTGGSFLPIQLNISNNTIENNYNTVSGPNDSNGVNLITNSVKLEGNFFKNNYNVAGGQAAVNGSCAISNNVFEVTGTFGSDATGGIEINGANFAITGNNILSYNANSGIIVAGASGVGYGTITGNSVKGGPAGAGGIVLYGNVTDPITAVAVTGNRVKALYGIQLNNFNTNINIFGNVLGESTNAYAVTGGALDPTVTGDIISKPLTTYTPTITSGSGSLTSASATGAYLKTGNLVYVAITISITTNGSAATDIRATLPFQAGARLSSLNGYEDAINGSQLKAKVPAFLQTALITKYDNTYLGGNGASLFVSGTYEATP